tara:strand:- start:4910 stop:5512 length:603 start_codon:yes stop_codon:yes gene_type:complete
MESLLQIIFSGIVTASTVVYALLTWRLVKETKLIREFQIKPDVRIYFERGEANNKLLFVVVENQGFGAALDVNFQVLKNLESYPEEYFNIKDKGVFKHGIVTLYPNQRHRYFILAIEKDNYNKVIEESLIIKTTYHDITNRKFNLTFNIPVKETVGVGLSTPPDNYSGRIPFYLERIDKSLKSLGKSVDELVTLKSDETE